MVKVVNLLAYVTRFKSFWRLNILTNFKKLLVLPSKTAWSNFLNFEILNLNLRKMHRPKIFENKGRLKNWLVSVDGLVVNWGSLNRRPTEGCPGSPQNFSNIDIC